MDTMDAIERKLFGLYSCIGRNTTPEQFEEDVGTMDRKFLRLGGRCGHTVMCSAAFLGNAKLVDYLADRYPELTFIAADNGITPLHLAVKSGSWEAVDSLLKHHAILNRTSNWHPDHQIHSKSDCTALDVAIHCGHKEIAERLMALGAVAGYH